MKKIFTLSLAFVLFTAAASAQRGDRDHDRDRGRDRDDRGYYKSDRDDHERFERRGNFIRFGINLRRNDNDSYRGDRDRRDDRRRDNDDRYYDRRRSY